MRLRRGVGAEGMPSQAQARDGFRERARARGGGRRACARRWSGASTLRALLCRRLDERGRRACSRTRPSRYDRAEQARARPRALLPRILEGGRGARSRRTSPPAQAPVEVGESASAREVDGACARRSPRKERCRRRRTKLGVDALALATLADAPALGPGSANAPAGVADPLRRRLSAGRAASPPGAPLRHVYPVA